MSSNSKWFLRVGILLFAFSLGAIATAEDGVTETEIRVGSTGAMTEGPARHIGAALASGAKALYDRVNASGGVAGRKITYTALDDHYSPEKGVSNAKNLIEKTKVFAFVGGSGTPIAQAILPMINKLGIPFLFNFSGGSLLYPKPPLKNGFQLRLSASDETAELVDYAVDKLNLKKVATFYQDDSYGTAGKSGVEKSLAKHGLKEMGSDAYSRNTLDVEKAVADLKAKAPEAIYLQATEPTIVAFVKKCVEQKYFPVFLAPSAAGSLMLKQELGNAPIDFYLSEILPSPSDLSLPVVKDFQRDMATAHQSITDGAGSLEGYVGALDFVEALKRAGKDLTRDSLEKALESMDDEDLGGVKIAFSAEQHVGLRNAHIVRLNAGQLKQIR